MTATAYLPTMTDLRGDAGVWPNYGVSHMPTRLGSSIDQAFHPSSSPVRPRSGAQAQDHHHHQQQQQHHSHNQAFSYTRYSHHDQIPFDSRPPPPSLQHSALLGCSHPQQQQQQAGYPPLKRSFSQADAPQPPYQELVQDLRADDGSSRLTVSQDHKLLSFRRSQDKSTVVDQHGRVQQLELSAQLHGMFFLSEMPSAVHGTTINAADGSPLQPELTCYRRNLFQISGSFVAPSGPLSVVVGGAVGEPGSQTLPITNMEVTVSAIESVDGNPVRLIVIPWKTPPPNSPDVSQKSDQEPPALPLIPFQDNNNNNSNNNGGSNHNSSTINTNSSNTAEGEYTMYPVGWRRLQFRIATANNGRRKELQQHFVLHLRVHGMLADGSRAVLTEALTSPIVVRGRSPRNFQARKEIPLLGSSAGSRGQALVETGVGVIASATALAMKQQQRRPDEARRGGSLDMQQLAPRSAFTFGSSGHKSVLGGQASALRSNSFPSWNQTTGSLGHPPPTTMGIPSVSAFAGGDAASAGGGGELPLAASSLAAAAAAAAAAAPVSLSQYAPPLTTTTTAALGATENVPRYVDSNNNSNGGRATKSPRHHQSQSSVHGSISAASDSTSDYRYGSYRMSSDAGASHTNPASYGSGDGGRADYYSPSHHHQHHHHHHQQQQQQQHQEHHHTNSWTGGSAAESESSLVAYATTDRPYAFDRSANLGARQEATLPTGNMYTPGTKGAFESLNNYSWSTN